MFKYVTLGWSSLIKELWVQPKNRNFIKPEGGIWACKYTPENKYISDWQEWCEDEDFCTGRMNIGVIFNIVDNARIYTIDCQEDLDQLMEAYEYVSSYHSLSSLDFEKISKDYDVIELTASGQCATRYSNPNKLYGWDVECILILNFDVISEQEGITI